MLIIPPIVFDRINIVARARISNAQTHAAPRAACFRNEQALELLAKVYGPVRWPKIQELSAKRPTIVFSRSRQGFLVTMLGLLGDWEVKIFHGTPVESNEAEALVLQRLSLFPDDIQVITPESSRPPGSTFCDWKDIEYRRASDHGHAL